MRVFLKKLLSIIIIWGFFYMPKTYCAYLQPDYQQDLQKLEELWQKEQLQSYMPVSATFAAGENLLVELLEEINTSKIEEGDEVTAKLVLPIKEKGQTIIPEGSLVKGEISQNIKKTKWSKPQSLLINFNEILIDDSTSIFIDAKIKTKDNTGVLRAPDTLTILKNSALSILCTTIGVAGILTFVSLALPSVWITAPLGMITGFLIGKRWIKNNSDNIVLPAETQLIITLEKDLIFDEL